MNDTQNATKGSERAAYSVNEVAVRHGISPGLVRLEISRGRLKAGRIGRRVIVTEAQIARWLEESSEKAARRV